MAGKSFDLQGGVVLIDPETGQSYSSGGVPSELKARVNLLGDNQYPPEPDGELGSLFITETGRLQVEVTPAPVTQDDTQYTTEPIAAVNDDAFYDTGGSQGCTTSIVSVVVDGLGFKGTITFTANSGPLGGIPIAGTRLDTGTLEKSAVLDLNNTNNSMVGWRFDTRGIDALQVTCTAYTSGSAKVYINSGR